ncbi:MAG TPA: hypothetical protein VLL94_11690 [Nitrospiraceae bacterium]|nr:hypothetical protein [Nitrospiraceae bacterium]
MRALAHSLIFLLFWASCAAVPTSSPTPALPMGEFIDQVLDPLAAQIVDEWAEQSKAEYAAQHPTAGSAGMMGKYVGKYVFAPNQEAIQKYNAEIDARRESLKKEILALFIQRAKSVGDQYSVCVEGAERRYGVKDNGFIQLPDGPGPCEKTVISTKGDPENTDR